MVGWHSLYVQKEIIAINTYNDNNIGTKDNFTIFKTNTLNKVIAKVSTVFNIKMMMSIKLIYFIRIIPLDFVCSH